MGAIVTGAGSAFSPFPFDQAQDIRGTVLQESFVGASALADADTDLVVPGTFVFADELGAAAANVTKLASEANHQGIVGLESGGSTAGDGIAVSFGKVGNTPFKLDKNGLVGSALIRIDSPLVTQELFVGFRQAGLVRPAASVDGDFGFLFLGATSVTEAEAVSNEGSTDEEVAITVIPAVDEWYLVEVYATDEGGYVRVANEDATQIARLDTVPDTADDYQFCVVSATSGTNEAVVDLDTLQVRHLVSKTPSAGTYGTLGGVNRLLTN